MQELEFDPETDAFLSRELVEAARWDINAFITAVMKDEKTGLPLDQAPVHVAWHDLADEHDRLLIWSAIEHGKAVPLTTPIPTPTGWTTMGALRVGDTVISRDGTPCSVTFATPAQYGRRVYLLRFDDGGTALADADHLWIAQRSKHGLLSAWGVHSTSQMLDAGLTSGGFHSWRIPLTAAVQYAPKTLPVNPYVLGAWLGDGDAAQPVLTFHRDDRFIYDRCKTLEGGDCEPKPDKRRPTTMRGNVGGWADKSRNHDPGRLRERLRTLGVLGNKHIPDVYLTASEGQRMELLRGLLDTDGHIGGRNPRVEFTSTEEPLALGVLELVRSLGFKASMSRERARLHGRDVGSKFRVCFVAGLRPVFALPRKLAVLRAASQKGRALYRTIVAIEEAPTEPVRCIRVDSPDSSYLMGRDYTVTHNTTQLSVARTLFALGRDPTLRIAIVSNTARQSEKVLRSIKRYIESSAELHAVFPDLRPVADQWTSHAITVRRKTMSKDPSIQAIGVHGSILGARLDLLIIDDLLDTDNTRTTKGREDCFMWVQANCLSRLTAIGRVLVVGTAFHPDDTLHRLARMPGFKAFRYPVLTNEGEPRWPERWPASRIARVKDTLGPLEFARQLLCVARSEDESRFKKEWIDWCLARGAGKDLVWGMDKLPPGFKTYTGVDLAVQQKDASDLTCLFTIAVHPNGDREVLCIESGKWSGPEIVSRIIETHQRFMSICIVENNAAQDFIVQFARGQFSVPIKPFTTGRNKAHPEFGVESIAAEIAGRKWIIPSHNGAPARPEIDKWVQEMLFYSPAAHTGDRLMASWFAREGARLGQLVVQRGFIDVMSR